ncbi:MAG: hypothetical protein UY18_C0030G0002 [Microgenomates group bacterium GW2011_GWF2_47_9]|nr:MAG: hypothetical protein UY18_C0030G0002 [Microgenomates group bacterium GW2011_GWF2_47_9]
MALGDLNSAKLAIKKSIQKTENKKGGKEFLLGLSPNFLAAISKLEREESGLALMVALMRRDAENIPELLNRIGITPARVFLHLATLAFAINGKQLSMEEVFRDAIIVQTLGDELKSDALQELLKQAKDAAVVEERQSVTPSVQRTALRDFLEIFEIIGAQRGSASTSDALVGEYVIAVDEHTEYRKPREDGG